MSQQNTDILPREEGGRPAPHRRGPALKGLLAVVVSALLLTCAYYAWQYYRTPEALPPPVTPAQIDATAQPQRRGDVPDGLAVTPGDGFLELSWNGVEGAAGYRVYVSRTGGDDYVSAGFTACESFTLRGLNNGERRYFRLRAYTLDENGEVYGPLSDEISAVPKGSILSLSQTVLVLQTGESAAIFCRLDDRPQNARWRSSDDGVVSVDGEGAVTAKGPGRAVVTAVASDGTELRCLCYVDRSASSPSAELSASRYVFEDGLWYDPTDGEDATAELLLMGELSPSAQVQEAALTDAGAYLFGDSVTLPTQLTEKADLSVCALEYLLSENRLYASELPVADSANAPCSYLEAVRAGGVDLVLGASERVCEGGPRALADTLSHLDEYGLMHTGSFADGEAPRYALVRVNGIYVGLLAYNMVTYGGDEALFTRSEYEAMVNTYARETARQDMEALRAVGAEYIIVYMNWGTEGCYAVEDSQRAEAQFLADDGADFIAGVNPGVVQTLELLTAGDGRTVPAAYSLGRIASATEDVQGGNVSAALHLTLTRAEDGGVSLTALSRTACRTLPALRGAGFTTVPQSGDALTRSFF